MAKESFDRDQLKEPDPFFEAVGSARRYIDEHKSLVITLAGGLVALLVVTALGSAYVAGQKNAAAATFSRAISSLADESPAAADAALANVTETSFAGPYRDASLFLRARLALDAGEADKALALYDEFLGSNPPEYLRQAALLGKAFALETAERASEAAPVYAEVAAIGGAYTADALESQARIAEAAGDKAGAAKALEKLLEMEVEGLDSERITRKVEALRGNGA